MRKILILLFISTSVNATVLEYNFSKRENINTLLYSLGYKKNSHDKIIKKYVKVVKKDKYELSNKGYMYTAYVKRPKKGFPFKCNYQIEDDRQLMIYRDLYNHQAQQEILKHRDYCKKGKERRSFTPRYAELKKKRDARRKLLLEKRRQLRAADDRVDSRWIPYFTFDYRVEKTTQPTANGEAYARSSVLPIIPEIGMTYTRDRWYNRFHFSFYESKTLIGNANTDENYFDIGAESGFILSFPFVELFVTGEIQQKKMLLFDVNTGIIDRETANFYKGHLKLDFPLYKNYSLIVDGFIGSSSGSVWNQTRGIKGGFKYWKGFFQPTIFTSAEITDGDSSYKSQFYRTGLTIDMRF